MIKPMFPHPWHTPHRASLTPEQHAARVVTIRRVAAAALLAVAVLLVVLVCTGDIPATMLLFAVGAAAAAPLARWGTGLFETVAPLPTITGADLVTEFPTMRVEAVKPAAGHYPARELAIAEAVKVYAPRHGSNTPTNVIPLVQAEVAR